MSTTDDTEPGPPSRGRVLIVEDDRATSRYLEVALERAGFIAESVGDAIGAERYLESADCDALLVDIGLPGPSGFDLVREMKAAHRTCQALMTDDASRMSPRALRAGPPDDFLPRLGQGADRAVERLFRRDGVPGRREGVLAPRHLADVEVGVCGILLWQRSWGTSAVATMTRRPAAAREGGGGEAPAATRSAPQRSARHRGEKSPKRATSAYRASRGVRPRSSKPNRGRPEPRSPSNPRASLVATGVSTVYCSLGEASSARSIPSGGSSRLDPSSQEKRGIGA